MNSPGRSSGSERGRGGQGRSRGGGPGPRGGGAGRRSGTGGRTTGGGRGHGARPQGPASENRSSGPDHDVHQPDGVRLQKLLAGAGWGSRRACEQLISEGRVEVDGQIVTELGVRVDPVTQIVHVDGTRVILDETKLYLAFNKPLGVVSTMSDELGRPSVGDYLIGRKDRLFHVGRLDADTEGLLLLTNDGDLAHRLQHPSYEIPKTYVAQVPGPVPRDLGKRLRAGIELEDGVVQVDSFALVDSLPGKAIVEVVLHEGRKHVVRRLLEEVGHPVQALARVEVGPVKLGNLRPGKMRPLRKDEVGGLYQAAGL